MAEAAMEEATEVVMEVEVAVAVVDRPVTRAVDTVTCLETARKVKSVTTVWILPITHP